MTTLLSTVFFLWLGWHVVKFLWKHGTLSKRNTWK
jgi:hypothetical protein